jgi:hypothetical protein
MTWLVPADPDRIPSIATHRGIGIHNCQSPARIRVVRAAIDRVAGMADVLALADFAADVNQPPEARLFACAKIEIEYQLSAEERRNRPIIDLQKVRGSVAGLDSVVWRSPVMYGTDLEHGGVPRDVPLDDSE